MKTLRRVMAYLSLFSVGGAGIGAAVGTFLLPGVGTIGGALVGTALGYYSGILTQAYFVLIPTPVKKQRLINLLSGSFSTISTGAVIGGLAGTFIFPGVGTILGSIIGGSVLALLVSVSIATLAAIKRYDAKFSTPVAAEEDLNQPIDAKSQKLKNIRNTLACLGVCGGMGTACGWILGTLVFPGLGTALGGILGGIVGSGIGYCAVTCLSVFRSNENKEPNKVAKLLGLAGVLAASSFVGAILGTFLFPGLGTGIGAALGFAGGTAFYGFALALNAFACKFLAPLAPKINSLFIRTPPIATSSHYSNISSSSYTDISAITFDKHNASLPETPGGGNSGWSDKHVEMYKKKLNPSGGEKRSDEVDASHSSRSNAAA